MTLRQAQGERRAGGRGGRIKVSLYLREDLFHMLRKRAAREDSSWGEVAEDILRRRFGG